MALNTLETFFKLFLACVLGGIIGLERESVNRPAGFRTHILVSVGATIVMITNMELVTIMSTTAEVQPGRFGASVISGIGFLGAGTIIKEGATVKGLTTAASLWATACIGLALGSGLYAIALGATIFVFLTLEVFPMIERKLAFKRNISKIQIVASNALGQLTAINHLFDDMNIIIRGIKSHKMSDETDLIQLTLRVKCSSKVTRNKLVDALLNIDGINDIIIDPE